LRDYIAERVINISNYIVKNKATVRQAAKCFGVSKSTVHQDVTKKLEKIDRGLAKQVRMVLDINKEERHIRGGLATKSKYKK
jgi:putative DeoR family transcriptional regulator (stage III sporulation protein D)